MKINKLCLNNFGRHEHLEISANAPVVGIIGSNGSGKSTILTGLKWLLTGLLEDEGASYIRTGAKRAEGYAEFIKNGRRGTITRRITPTSSTRELTLEGEAEPIKKAADVDARMSELLGADRQAISNAVFIPQGEMRQLLFGDNAERERLLCRLVNVSFLEKVAGVVDQKLKSLGDSVEDVALLLDEARAQETIASGAAAHARAAAQAFPDNSARLGQLRRLQQLQRSITAAHTAVAGNASAVQLVERELESAVRLLGYEDRSQLTDKETFHASRRDRLTDRISQLKDANRWADRMSQATMMALAALNEEATLKLSIDQLMPAVAGINLQALYTELLAAQKSRDDFARLTTLKRSAEASSAALMAHMAVPVAKGETITALKVAIATREADLTRLDQRIKVLSAAGTVDNTCPCCEQSIAPGTLSADKLAAAKAVYMEGHRALLADQAAVKLAEQAQIAYDFRLRQLSQDMASNMKAVAELGVVHEVTAEHVVQLSARYKTASDANTAIRLKTDQLVQVGHRISQANAEKAAAQAELTKYGMLDRGELPTAEFDLEDSRRQLNSIAASKVRLAGLDRQKEQLEASTVAQQRLLATDQSELNSLWSAVGLHASSSDIEMTTMLQDAELVATRRAEAVGASVATEAAAVQARIRVTGLEDRMKAGERRRAAIADLKRLRETFSRSGLPVTYMDYQFRRLLPLVQGTLATLGSNFTVGADPERAAAFTFTRLDGDNGELSMGKLSGGQAVRLSLAFIIAVQRLLIPEVGLLVLDEPSTHIDQEGIENLRSMLISMSSTLDNAEHQLWVVDHHEALQPAFGCCTKL